MSKYCLCKIFSVKLVLVGDSTSFKRLTGAIYQRYMYICLQRLLFAIRIFVYIPETLKDQLTASNILDKLALANLANISPTPITVCLPYYVLRLPDLNSLAFTRQQWVKLCCVLHVINGWGYIIYDWNKNEQLSFKFN